MCLYFLMRSPFSFCLVQWVAVNSLGIFICWLWCPTSLFLPPCAEGGWILFYRNSLWLLEGQYLASGFIVRGLTKCSLCAEGGSSQNGCCLMLFHISSTCSSAKSILVDRGKRRSSFVFLRTWSIIYHLVAGEEKREFIFGLKDSAKSLLVTETVACARFQEIYMLLYNCPITNGCHFWNHGLVCWRVKVETSEDGA